MPRRTDLNHVLVIGSGPIVIGQACEFDYSGTQACRVLRAEGLQVSLINSNPATIMTDPEYADNTYVEPITPEFVEKVLAQQAERGNKIDAVLATLGGQMGLFSEAVAGLIPEDREIDLFAVGMIGGKEGIREAIAVKIEAIDQAERAIRGGVHIDAAIGERAFGKGAEAVEVPALAGLGTEERAGAEGKRSASETKLTGTVKEHHFKETLTLWTMG